MDMITDSTSREDISEGDMRYASTGRHFLDSENRPNFSEGVETSDDTSGTDDVILSVFFRRGYFGAAAYSVETSEMHLLSDVIDSGPEYRIFTTLFLQLQPTQVITCPSLSHIFLQRVNSLVNGGEAGSTPSGPIQPTNKLHFAPNKEFHYENSKRKITSLKLPSEPQNASPEERQMFIMSMINFQDKSLVSALGGILYYMQRSLARITLCRADMSISAIHNLSLDELMWVDEETFCGLQIFAPVSHPSSYKWSRSGYKDGLSIFSLLNRCRSTLGTKHMRVMLTQPSKNMRVLLARQQVISFCLLMKNEQEVKSLADYIQSIKSVAKFMTRTTNGQASVSQWKEFYKTLYNAVLVAQLCKINEEDIEFFQKIGEVLDDNLYIMATAINRIIDFELSEEENRVVVQFRISDDLDKLKEVHSNIPRIMSTVTEQELECLPLFVSSCSMVYIPEIGYLLAIPFWDPNLTEDELRSFPGLDYRYTVKDTAYYKSARCYELDNELGDTQLSIMEMESKIVLKLIQYIQQNIGSLVTLIGFIAELDCLLALSYVARDYNFVCPELVEGRVIEIVKGRHPLQELCTSMFVANDSVSNEEQGIVKILTGPNASGKSIYLKQVALIAYLAHIGSFIPAESAKIGLLDHLHTRIQSVESVALQLSSFMADIKQMTLSVYNSSPTSLIVIDEFGKGTNECDGLALLAACVQHFIARDNNCPHLLISTHFSTLPDLLPQSALLSFQTMDYMVTDAGEIVYLYRIKSGVADYSFAIQIAIAKDVQKSITDRAAQVLEAIKQSGVIRTDPSNKNIQLLKKKKIFFEKIASMNIDSVSNDKEEELMKELEQLAT